MALIIDCASTGGSHKTAPHGPRQVTEPHKLYATVGCPGRSRLARLFRHHIIGVVMEGRVPRLFGRTRQVEPSFNNPFDDSWFERWWDDIFRESGVQPDDGQNDFQLRFSTFHLLDSWAAEFAANGLLKRRDEGRYQDSVRAHAGAGERAAILAASHPK